MSPNKVRTAPVIRGLGEVTVEPEPVRNHGNLIPLPRFDDAWKEFAACRTADPELFAAYTGEKVRKALAYCNTCPVVADCLDLAELHVGHHLPVSGVWGGKVWTVSVTSVKDQGPNLRLLQAAGLKPCGKCGRSKRLDEFHRDRKSADGRHTLCAACRRAYRNDRSWQK